MAASLPPDTSLAEAPSSSSRRAAVLAELRARIAAIDGTAPLAAGEGGIPAILPFGDERLNAALPWGGLPLGALHDIRGSARDGAAAGFLTVILANLLRHPAPRVRPGGEGSGRHILWCLDRARPYGPGLRAFGLDPAALILVRGRNRTETLWAMEEGLRAGGLAAVVGELDRLDLTASRRLQLAAEAGGVPGFLLRTPQREFRKHPGRNRQKHEEIPARATSPTAAVTAWRIAPAPSGDDVPLSGLPGHVRWRVDLTRCRGGVPGSWMVQWSCRSIENETDSFAVVPPLGDRPLQLPRSPEGTGGARPEGDALPASGRFSRAG